MKSVATIDAHHHIWRLDDLPWLSGRRCRAFDLRDPSASAGGAAEAYVTSVASPQ
jgi:predicted TIM-barrel fold metal-dependent hydrolase